MSGLRLPLAFSLAAHSIVLGLLFMLPPPAPPAAPPLAGGIEVAFAPSLPATQPPRLQPVKAEPAPPPPSVQTPPPLATIEPPPAPEASVAIPEPLAMPPSPKPPVPPPRRLAVRHFERPVQRPEEPRPTAVASPPAPAVPAAATAPIQQAALTPPVRQPAAAQSVAVSPGYRALLGEWLNSHKRYPERARERGEQGHAVLRFSVERSGRVTDFTVVKSSGYADLDHGLEEMMRGASLPPFPADMPQASMSISVTIHFSLE